ncbi:MAG: ABC transporter permease [Candidatus Adiutricales bacterium]
MKIISVIRKSVKEQIRHFWIFVLTITMAPFFVLVYYLISETAEPHYKLLILNQDAGIESSADNLNYGNRLLEMIKYIDKSGLDIPLTPLAVETRADGLKKMKQKKADAMVVLPKDFSLSIHNAVNTKSGSPVTVEFIGDVTSYNYMISALWANEFIKEFVYVSTQQSNPLLVKETGLGASASLDYFDIFMPGILVLSVIMLMFSATIAIVAEVENKTILRLKLSKVSSLEFLTGVGLVQILIGIISLLLTLAVAVSLGFDFQGSLHILLFMAILASISIIAFSLIIAAFTKTVNEVLVVGNFPLFLFMFFTGAAFPIQGRTLFSVADYPITIQGLMSPTHAISALNKVLIMGMGIKDILPEIAVLGVITAIYFIVGVWFFRTRHMKVA